MFKLFNKFPGSLKKKLSSTNIDLVETSLNCPIEKLEENKFLKFCLKFN